MAYTSYSDIGLEKFTPFLVANSSRISLDDKKINPANSSNMGILKFAANQGQSSEQGGNDYNTGDLDKHTKFSITEDRVNLDDRKLNPVVPRKEEDKKYRDVDYDSDNYGEFYVKNPKRLRVYGNVDDKKPLQYLVEPFAEVFRKLRQGYSKKDYEVEVKEQDANEKSEDKNLYAVVRNLFSRLKPYIEDKIGYVKKNSVYNNNKNDVGERYPVVGYPNESENYANSTEYTIVGYQKPSDLERELIERPKIVPIRRNSPLEDRVDLMAA